MAEINAHTGDSTPTLNGELEARTHHHSVLSAGGVHSIHTVAALTPSAARAALSRSTQFRSIMHSGQAPASTIASTPWNRIWAGPGSHCSAIWLEIPSGAPTTTHRSHPAIPCYSIRSSSMRVCHRAGLEVANVDTGWTRQCIAAAHEQASGNRQAESAPTALASECRSSSATGEDRNLAEGGCQPLRTGLLQGARIADNRRALGPGTAAAPEARQAGTALGTLVSMRCG